MSEGKEVVGGGAGGVAGGSDSDFKFGGKRRYKQRFRTMQSSVWLHESARRHGGDAKQRRYKNEERGEQRGGDMRGNGREHVEGRENGMEGGSLPRTYPTSIDSRFARAVSPDDSAVIEAPPR